MVIVHGYRQLTLHLIPQSESVEILIDALQRAAVDPPNNLLSGKWTSAGSVLSRL